MLWVPQKGALQVQHNIGSVGASYPGTSVTTGATSSTKGTPAEIFSSTSFDSYGMFIVAHSYGLAGNATEGSMDILIGSATEEVLIANLLHGYCGANIGAIHSGPKLWYFPLYTPAGSRIAVQAAGNKRSTAFYVAMFLYGGNGIPPWRVGTKVTTYGMGTVPNGTSITPGTSGAEGSWTQITASTSEDHFCLIPSFQPSSDITIQAGTLAIDLGIGSATEEQIVESLWMDKGANEVIGGPYNNWPIYQDIPSGTRLAMRISSSGSADSGQNAVIHAMS